MLLRFSLVLGVLLSPSAKALDCEVSSQAPVESVVEFRSEVNQLKVTAREQPLYVVLAAVSRKTGIEFIGDAGRCDRVTVNFEFLAMKSALSQLLKDRNYIVRVDTRQHTTQVWLLPVGSVDGPTEDQFLRDEFYRELQGAPNLEKLAEQINNLEK